MTYWKWLKVYMVYRTHPGYGGMKLQIICANWDSSIIVWMLRSWYCIKTGSVSAMLVLHVDDVMVRSDGSKFAEERIQAFYEKYPFGAWEDVKKIGQVEYTGRAIILRGDEILLTQKSFVEGRMEPLKVPRDAKRSLDSPCTPVEHAEYRSCAGNLHWATSQTRVDHAVDVSRL